MTTEYTTIGQTYTISVHTVGDDLGTVAEVRRGGFVARTETFPLGSIESAIKAGRELADNHAAFCDDVELRREIDWRHAIHNAERIYVGNRIPLCPCGCGKTNMCQGTRNRLDLLGRRLEAAYRATPKGQAEAARWRAWLEEFNARPGDHV